MSNTKTVAHQDAETQAAGTERTQIFLPVDLKRQAEHVRVDCGLSLSALCEKGLRMQLAELERESAKGKK